MKLIFLYISFIFLVNYIINSHPLEGTKWDLYSIQNDKENFKYVLYKVTSTIEFGDSICAAGGPCNGFGGYYKIEKDVILFRDLASTLRGCHGDNEIVESFVHKNLRKLFYKINSDTLVLSDWNGVVLKYTKKK